MLEEWTEVAVDQDQDQGQIKTETKLDASDVENMIILPSIVKPWKCRKNQSDQLQQLMNTEEWSGTLKLFAEEIYTV